MKRITQILLGKLLLLALAIAVAAGGSIAHAGCTPPPSGIVAWWPAEGNALDIIGANNGTLVNGTSFTNGEVGEAFYFNGINNFVLVNASPSLMTGLQNGFTFESWINPATVTSTVELFEYERALATYNGSDVGILFAIHNQMPDGSPGSCLYANLVDTNNAHVLASPANILAAGIWQHVALTYDRASGAAAIYINGVAVTQTNLGVFTPITGFTNLLLGARTTYGSIANPPNAYAGSMDEASFYNRALSSNEIAAIYHTGSAGKCTTPVAPYITAQPQGQTNAVGGSASFVVVVGGTAPLSYQWSFNHTNLVGATNATLTLNNLQPNQAGNYAVLVSNVAGSTNSAVAVLTVPTTTPPSCDPPPLGIVAWWPGQGNATDIIGGNNGTLVNGTSFTNGEVGSAFDLAGGQYVVANPATPSSLDVGQGSGLTFEEWINPTTVTAEELLFEYERALGTPNGSDVGVTFAIHADSGGILFANVLDTNDVAHNFYTPPGLLVPGVWQHIALTYDKASGVGVLYINGTGVTVTNLGSFTPHTSFTNFLMGARTTFNSTANPGAQYTGLLDEISVYNRALSSNEIAAIYHAGSAGKCTTPVAPYITMQPQSQTNTVGGSASFVVVAGGTAPLSYQWSFNHTNLLGATNATLTLPNVQLAQAGSYAVVVSNFAGSTNSLTALLTVLTPVPPSCDPPPSGIVAWWPGQGNANDIIGGNNGKVEGGLGFAPGEVGQAFLFTATNEDVKIPASASLNVGATNGFTLEAWVNCYNPSALNPIFEWNQGDGMTYWGVHFYVGAAGPGSLYANVVDSTGNWHRLWSAPGIVASNVFTHAALTYDKASGVATLYCNGTVEAQSNLGSFTPLTTYSLYLGRRIGPDANFTFSGMIDEPSIYNRALSSNEVAAIYLAGSAGKCQPSPLAPVITRQPTNLTVTASNTAVFAVTATGTAPLSYQWSFNHTNLLGATNATLVLPNVQPAQAGSYAVVVSNIVGSTNSLAALLTVLTPAPPSCDPPPSGIVAWWPGQGNANDIIGGNNGTLINGTGFASGEVGTAFSLNGVNNYLLINPASPSSLDVGVAGGLTFEEWIKPNTVSTEEVMLEYERALGTANGADVGVTFAIHATGILIADLIGASGGSHIIATPPNFVAAGVWQHIALTYDQASGQAQFYINGASVAVTNLGSYALQTSFTNIVLGARTTYGSAANPVVPFSGLLDEPTIYNRALTSNEIVAIYLAGSAGKCFTPTPPFITTQPQSQTNAVGGSASFVVVAGGTAPLSYQWSFNHTNLVGATNATLILNNLQPNQAGNYAVLVSNVAGSTNSTVAVLTLPIILPPSCDPPPSGIVAWWPGQGNANDIIGGDNGTLVGAAGYANGEVGQAFVFNGNMEVVTVGNPTNLQLQNFTIETWVKRASASVVTAPGGNGCLFTYGANGYGLYLDNNGVPALSQIGVSATQPAAAITDTNFHHVAVTKAGSAVNFYIDGIAYSAPAYNPIFTFSTVAAIGGRGDNFDNSFLGVIDEVSVYNRALSSNEIAAIYLAGSAGKCFTPAPPVITAQPQSQTNMVGGSASFSVTGTGTPSLSYQWSFNHTNLVGATNATLTLNNLQPNQAGNYAVLVSNVAGSTNSAAAVLTVLTPTPPSCDPAPSGIVAWWPGQENANDIIGGNNGALLDGIGFTNGEVGNAFNFTGNSLVLVNPVTTGSLDVGQAGGLTIEGWVNPSTISPAMIIAIYENALNTANGANVGPCFLMDNIPNNGPVPGCLAVNINDTNNVSHIAGTPPNVLVPGVWQHVAFTYNKSSGFAAFYANGVAVTRTNLGVFIPQTSFTNLEFGGQTTYASLSSPANQFSGQIDELSLYNRALTPNEIAAIYLAGSAGKCPPSPVAPIITQQPTNLTVTASNTAVFGVTATGAAPLSYQWSFNHANLLGATNATLTLPNVQPSQAGSYAVVVSNIVGSTNSLAALLTVLTPAPPSCDPPPSGIVAWWPGQGNANDIIGGNNGTLMNGTGFTNGEVGLAFSLNGINNFVLANPSAPANFNVGTNGLTLETWIKPATVSAQQILFEYERSLGTGNGLDVGMNFAIQPATTNAALYAAFNDVNYSALHQFASPASLVAGVWQHVALTYDTASGVAALYLNGQSITVTNLGSFVPLTSFTNLLLGARTYLGAASSPNTVYSGLMDEPSLYKRALSANEIAAIYLAGSAGKCLPSPLAPVITQQPTNLTLTASNTAVFTVTAGGTAPLSYQWSFNHTNLLGATNATLTLPNVQPAQAGSYAVVVSNFVGSTNSLAALLTVLTPAPPSCDAPPSGIVAWWPGQGNANDIIGGNNGTPVGSVGYTNGEVGEAFSFDGTDFLVVSNQPALNPTNALTVECWAYTRGHSVPQTWTQQLLTKDSDCNGTRQFVLEIGDSQTQSGSPDFRGAIWVPAGVVIVDGATVVQTNSWYHVAVTYDGATLKLYVNGALDGQLAASGPILTFPEPVRIGGGVDNGCQAYNLNGLLDEPTIYNRALSSNEIAAIYKAGSAGKCTAPAETVLSMVATNAMSGTTVTMPICMNALGVENTFLASVGYDPTKLVLQNIQLGQATAGAYLQELDKYTNSGLVGFAILLNNGVTLPAGTNEQVALVNFQALPVTSNTVTSLYFTNSPALQQVYDTNFNLLPALYAGGTVTLLPAEYEADVYPRTNGDHQVTVPDWLEEGRMVAGLDTPANPDEFRRADCAPRNAPDGVLTVADWVQAGRYALGLDPLTLVTTPPAPNLATRFKPNGSSMPSRILSIGTVSAQRGQTVSLPIQLVCSTNENAVGLTATYNPSQLTLTGVSLGSALPGGRLNINSNLLTGNLGLDLALPPGATLPAGTNQIAVLQFLANTNASGAASVTLNNTVAVLQVVDQFASSVPTAYVSGAVVLPPQPAVSVTGTGAKMQLSWPIATGTFQVQTSDSMIGPWTTIVLPIITNGANASVIVSPTNQQQYFRLEGQ